MQGQRREPFYIFVYCEGQSHKDNITPLASINSSTFLQILPELVTPLNGWGTLYLRAAVHRRCQHPPKALGTVEAT